MFGQTPTWIGFVCPNLVIAFLSDANWRAFISFGFQEFGTHSLIFTVLICAVGFVIWLRSCTRYCLSGLDLRHSTPTTCDRASALPLCDASAPSQAVFPASLPRPLCSGRGR